MATIDFLFEFKKGCQQVVVKSNMLVSRGDRQCTAEGKVSDYFINEIKGCGENNKRTEQWQKERRRRGMLGLLCIAASLSKS